MHLPPQAIQDITRNRDIDPEEIVSLIFERIDVKGEGKKRGTANNWASSTVARVKCNGMTFDPTGEMTLEEFIEGARDHEDIMDMLKKIMDLTPVLVIIVQGRNGWRPAADKDYKQILMAYSTVKKITSLKEKKEKQTSSTCTCTLKSLQKEKLPGSPRTSEHGWTWETVGDVVHFVSLKWFESTMWVQNRSSPFDLFSNCPKEKLPEMFFLYKTLKQNKKRQKKQKKRSWLNSSLSVDTFVWTNKCRTHIPQWTTTKKKNHMDQTNRVLRYFQTIYGQHLGSKRHQQALAPSFLFDRFFKGDGGDAV